MDVKTTFLNDNLEAIYMKQLDDFQEKGKEHLVKLKNYLYGLKQVPR